MIILLDTNVLLRAFQADHADHDLAQAAVEFLRRERHVLAVVPQVVYEYWVVATRPVEQNGFGLESEEAEQRIDRITSVFRFQRDERGIFNKWRTLVAQHQVLGKRAHDARLAAAMLRHDIRTILTFNVRDFSRYPAIRAISPRDVVNGQASL